MKKIYPISILIFSSLMFFNAKAASEGKCGETDEDCHYNLSDTGHLKITGSGALTSYPWNRSAVYSLEIDDGITSIAQAAFRGGQYTEVDIPNSVESIGFQAFYSNTLTEATLGKIIETQAFRDAINLKTVTIKEGVTSLAESAFNAMVNLEKITLPDTLETINQKAFWNTPKLESIELPENLKTIGFGAFYSSGINQIDIPDSVTSIAATAFGNSDITTMSIGKSLEVTTAGGATNLESVIIRDGVTKIAPDAFRNLKNLETVVLPDGVETIGNSAFFGCTKLKDLFIPDSVTFIDGFALAGVTANIYCNDTSKDRCKNLVYGTGMVQGTGFAGTLNLYTVDNNGIYHIGNKKFASYSDMLAGKQLRKRIYTVDEATKLSKPAGNTFRLRYK
ncbi:MAG: leucine-rich repeat domain-containing protein [Alphaproteobacteria bacterium]|nr:leucine-rich repeat domain-containing protein [Alphaproteobacteria bacterium]